MEKIKDLFNSLVKQDEVQAQADFGAAIGEKLQQALDVRKISVTADVFNKPQSVKEEVEVIDESKSDINKLLKGGNTKIPAAKIDSILGDLYDDSKATKSLVRNKVYQEGEDNPKKKNPYKKDTADFHLYQLGQQVQQTRG